MSRVGALAVVALLALPAGLVACGGGATKAPRGAEKVDVAAARTRPSCADDPAPGVDEGEAFGRPIASICVDGASPAARVIVEKSLGLVVGAVLTETALGRGLASIHAAGVAEDVTAYGRRAANGVALIVVVRERRRIRKVEFEGASSATIAPGHATLEHAGEYYDPEKSLEDAAAIRGLYREAGFDDATVVPKAAKRGSDQVDLTLVVSEGIRSRVGVVTFQGARTAFEGPLREVTGLVPGATLSTEKLERAPAQITAFYDDRGYIQAHAEVTRGDRDREGAVPITFRVVEGDVFKFGKIALAKHGLTAAEASAIVAKLRSRPGEVFNQSLLRADVEAVTRALAERGRKVSITPLPNVDVKKRTIDIQLELDEPPHG